MVCGCGLDKLVVGAVWGDYKLVAVGWGEGQVGSEPCRRRASGVRWAPWAPLRTAVQHKPGRSARVWAGEVQAR